MTTPVPLVTGHGYSRAQMHEIAQGIALMFNKVAVPGRRYRPDIGHIQVDPCRVKDAGIERDAVRLQFELEGERSCQIVVRFHEYARDPLGYLRALARNVRDMGREAYRLRHETLGPVEMMHRKMKREGAINE